MARFCLFYVIKKTEIIIETIATEIGMASVKIEQRFLRDGIVCAVMHIKIAYLGADLRPKQIPDSIIQMMK